MAGVLYRGAGQLIRCGTAALCLFALSVLPAAETQHLRLTSSASAERARAGDRITLTLDIELKPEMHVYAPAVKGYTPITWSMAPNPAIVAHAMAAPPAQMLHLPALDETLPVYSGRLRLTRQIAIAKNAKWSGDLTIQGTFRYQACDNRMCYLAKTVPVQWIFHPAQ